MPITYEKTVATFAGLCEIEEAENLFEWLLENPDGEINLESLQHLHTAILQVLMALKPHVAALPANESVASWLAAALAQSHES